MRSTRLSRDDLDRHLVDHPPNVRAIVRALRKTVLATVPGAYEAFKFRVLCYFRQDAYFKSIGGNICMIEIKHGEVLLSFILGRWMKDPDGLLEGARKHKRFVRVPDVGFARSRAVVRLVRAAAEVDAFDGSEGPAK